MIGVEGQHRFHFPDDVGEPIELVIGGAKVKSQIFIVGVIFQSLFKCRRRLFKFIGLQVAQSQQQMGLRVAGFQPDGLGQMPHRFIIARESIQ